MFRLSHFDQGKELTKIIKQLNAATVYKFRVRAYNTCGTSPWSEEVLSCISKAPHHLILQVSFRTSEGPPPQPPPPALLRVMSRELTIWFHGADRGGGGMEHRVEVADDEDGPFDVQWNGYEDRYTV